MRIVYAKFCKLRKLKERGNDSPSISRLRQAEGVGGAQLPTLFRIIYLLNFRYTIRMRISL
jgi:hypothetical protein